MIGPSHGTTHLTGFGLNQLDAPAACDSQPMEPLSRYPYSFGLNMLRVTVSRDGRQEVNPIPATGLGEVPAEPAGGGWVATTVASLEDEDPAAEPRGTPDQQPETAQVAAPAASPRMTGLPETCIQEESHQTMEAEVATPVASLQRSGPTEVCPQDVDDRTNSEPAQLPVRQNHPRPDIDCLANHRYRTINIYLIC